VKFVVAAVVGFGPLQLAVVADQVVADVVGGGDGDVLAKGAGTADCRAGELDADCAGTCRRVIRALVQPDEIGDPALSPPRLMCQQKTLKETQRGMERSLGMTVTAEHDVVRDVVVVKNRQGAVAVGLIPVPSIVIQRVRISGCDRYVLSREHDLATDDSPSGASIGRLDQVAVEPILLSTTHQGSARIVGDLTDVISVPVQVGDGPVVLSSVQHEEVDEIPYLEAPPDTQIVVHLYLTGC
jgi:hypothetical protein